MSTVARKANQSTGRGKGRKSPDAFRTISEVANELDVPQHVLRFWETRFTQIKPLKRGGGRRYYRPEDLLLLRGIRRLLYDDGYTIKGVQKVLKEKGVKAVIEAVKDSPVVNGGLAAVVHENGHDDSGAAAARAGANAKTQAALGAILDELVDLRDTLKN